MTKLIIILLSAVFINNYHTAIRADLSVIAIACAGGFNILYVGLRVVALLLNVKHKVARFVNGKYVSVAVGISVDLTVIVFMPFAFTLFGEYSAFGSIDHFLEVSNVFCIKFKG